MAKETAKLENRLLSVDPVKYTDILMTFIDKNATGNVLCLFIGNTLTEIKIAKSLPNAKVYVADIPQSGLELYNIKYVHRFEPMYDYEQDEIISEVQKMFEGLKMKFDYVLINPPFSLGNAVATECLKHSDKVVCLMPLSKYKKGKLWSKITQFSLADPKLFTDALITPNLSISTLENNAKPKFESANHLDLTGYNPDYVEFYRYNLDHWGTAFTDVTVWHTKKTENIEPKRWFIMNVRVCADGVHGKDSDDYRWNVERKTEVNWKTLEDFYQLPSEKAKDNLCKWWYRGKNTFVSKLIWGLNKNGSNAHPVYPQINWEEIENTDAWKAGDYDTAVLDMMGLVIVDGKIVKKSTALFASEEALNLETYDQNFREYYKYNMENWGTAFEDVAIYGSKKTLNMDPKRWFIMSVRVCNDGAHGEDGVDYKWNVLKQTENLNMKSIEDCYLLPSEKAKDNLCKWWYRGKDTLVNALILGLHKSGTNAHHSYPQINWEEIEESPLWKQGLYDEAVLDEMGLKMVDGKITTK